MAWIQLLASASDCCQETALAPEDVVVAAMVGVLPPLPMEW